MEIIGQEKNMEMLELCFEHKLSALLIGPTGTAKTSSIAAVARKYDQKVVRGPITGETTTNEFVGRYELEPTKTGSRTIWVDGPLKEAVEKGYCFVADEVNMALPEILSLLHPLLDHDNKLIVSQKNGQEITPHPNFRFFATINPVDEYAGTKELNKAFMSRFVMVLYYDYPDEKTEAGIIAHHWGIEKAAAKKLAKIGKRLRDLKDKTKIFYVCSTRDLIYTAQLMTLGMSMSDALNVSIINRTDSMERQTVADVCAQVINPPPKKPTPKKKINESSITVTSTGVSTEEALRNMYRRLTATGATGRLFVDQYGFEYER